MVNLYAPRAKFALTHLRRWKLPERTLVQYELYHVSRAL